MAKINIELGGKYTFGDTINKAQNDLKKFGGETKDAGSIATATLKGVADIAGNDVAKAINGLSGVISGLATGGLFGMVAAAAGTAFTFIKDQIEKAKEEAKNLAEAIKQSLVLGVDKIKESIKGIGVESDEGKKKIEEMIKVAQGAATSDAKIKVAELHVQTLQKITDDMSEVGKKSIQAQEAYEAAIIKWNAQITANADTQAFMRERQTQVDNSLYEVSNELFQLKSEESEWSKKNSAELYRYQSLLQSANTTIEELVNAGVSETEAQKWHAQKLKEKVEFEEKYVGFVAEYNERQKALSDATALQKKLMDEKHQLEVKLAEAIQEETVIRAESAAQMKELDMQARLAQEAYAKENEAKQIAMILQQNENALLLDIQNTMSKLNLTQEVQDKLMEVVNQGLQDELEEAEIRDNVEREYRRLKEEHNKLQDESNKLLEKDNNDTKTGKKQPIDISMSSNIGVKIDNTSELGNEIGQDAKDKLNVRDRQAQDRADERRGRDMWTAWKTNVPNAVKLYNDYVNGKINKDQALSWLETLKSTEWTDKMQLAAKKHFGISDDKPLSPLQAIKMAATQGQLWKPHELRKFNTFIDTAEKKLQENEDDEKTKRIKMYTNIESMATEIKQASIK